MSIEFLFVGAGLCAWLFSIVLLGAFCGLTDDHPRKPLERRPNVRLVRDEEDSAA